MVAENEGSVACAITQPVSPDSNSISCAATGGQSANRPAGTASAQANRRACAAAARRSGRLRMGDPRWRSSTVDCRESTPWFPVPTPESDCGPGDGDRVATTQGERRQSPIVQAVQSSRHTIDACLRGLGESSGEISCTGAEIYRVFMSDAGRASRGLASRRHAASKGAGLTAGPRFWPAAPAAGRKARAPTDSCSWPAAPAAGPKARAPSRGAALRATSDPR